MTHAVSVGFVACEFRAGATSGGTEILAKLLNHFYGLREAWPDLVGFALFDRLDRQLTELTGVIEQELGARPTTYRAGRNGFDARTIPILERLGYTVVDPVSVMGTHLAELARRHAHELFTRQDAKLLLDREAEIMALFNARKEFLKLAGILGPDLFVGLAVTRLLRVRVPRCFRRSASSAT